MWGVWYVFYSGHTIHFPCVSVWITGPECKQQPCVNVIKSTIINKMSIRALSQIKELWCHKLDILPPDILLVSRGGFRQTEGGHNHLTLGHVTLFHIKTRKFGWSRRIKCCQAQSQLNSNSTQFQSQFICSLSSHSPTHPVQ